MDFPTRGNDPENIYSEDFLRQIISRITPGGQFGKYRDDPVAFAHDVLGVRLWAKQEEILSGLVHDPRLAVRSGHGMGKSFTSAVTVLWFANTRQNVAVLTTAPTHRQVKTVLWREINRLHANAVKPLPGQVLQTELTLPSGSFALGFATDDAARFQGIHAEEVLVVEDEAPGVPETIHEGIEGVLSGGGYWLKIGNPVEASGSFFNAFRSPVWKSLSVSCWDHPNVVEDRTVIPGAVTRQWCADRLEEWGEDSPLYQSRVLGEFPQEGEDTLIRLAWAEKAFDVEKVPEGEKKLVCDVARYGSDFTVIGLWHGPVYRELLRYQGKDLMTTSGELMRLSREWKPEAIVVDDDGLGGGVVDRLTELGANVAPFKGGETSNEPDRFLNKRAEAWWSMREKLRSGDVRIEASDPDGLKYQLTAPRYQITSRGQIQIESKEQMKKRGVKSPDRADCMAMGCATLWAPLWSL